MKRAISIKPHSEGSRNMSIGIGFLLGPLLDKLDALTSLIPPSLLPRRYRFAPRAW
jgi:hypothetical protein